MSDDTLVVFSADHGESLGENGIFGHGGNLDSVVEHIPLVMYHPGLKPDQAHCLAENVDTMPTVLTAMGLEVPDNLDGHPLQQGCRKYTHASVYTPAGTLGFVTVEDGTNYAQWSCGAPRVRFADNASGRPTEDVAHGLYDELSAFTGELLAAHPEPECTFPAWSWP